MGRGRMVDVVAMGACGSVFAFVWGGSEAFRLRRRSVGEV